MGQTCSCKSMLSVSNTEITKKNELSPLNESQNSSQEIYLQVEKSSRAYTTDYPQKFIIIYPTRKENFDCLKNELKHLNKDVSLIIYECENLSQDLNYSQDLSSYLPSSLEDFKL